jgi:hypothetical protein
MTTIRGLRYFEVDFNADGGLNTDTGAGSGGLPEAVAAGGISDLFVFSHGWNTGVGSARDLYNDMFGQLADQLGPHLGTSAAVGVIWPSLVFPDDAPASSPAVPSTGSQLAAALAPAFPDQQQALTTIGQLLDDQPQDPDRLNEFHTLATSLVTTPSNAVEDSGEGAFADDPTGTVLAYAHGLAPKTASGGQAGLNPFTALWTGAREVLRTLSYYEMKNRAGVVGSQGLGPLLAGLAGPGGPPRIHLLGHSFGARLVSYSLAGLKADQTGGGSPVKSLTLIQGAFSHFAFASDLPFNPGHTGALVGFRDRVDGPLLATFTAADRAVGWWYPTASALKREDNQSASDLTFRWGAMGHDGYQQDPAPIAVPLAATGHVYNFAPRRFYSLDSNAVICADQSAFSGAHSDIRHPEVLCAVLNAAGLAG